MSILYPRLLDQAARDMHYRFTTMSVEQLRELRAFGHPSAVFAATGGQRVPAGYLEELREQIVKAAEEAGFPAAARRGSHAEFDRVVAQLLHERCGLVAAEAAVRPIWAFLALVVLPDVSYWRFPDPPPDRVLATDITRHVWGRLWWRAHLLVLPEEFADRYRLLATFGEADFDQIYARRSMLGGSRTLIRAIAETWPTIDRGGLQSRDVLRDLLKRLLRVAPVLEFDALDDLELRDQIRWEARNSVLELRRAGVGSDRPVDR
ncbi:MULTISPECIES: DUF6339 family protein [unclassified Pseudonocardia]|uniref:DUF6339 family protein n=1 Tax=unclassified Pseudonocardia TaxID=2619320 RepID=UPI000760FEF7|nr:MULTISPECIES: DUF6339 family protein [unclassified Pseudonocardia]